MVVLLFVPKMPHSDPVIGCQGEYQVAEYVKWQRAPLEHQ